MLWATSAGALPLGAPATAGTSTGIITYQGRPADAGACPGLAEGATPFTGTYTIAFRLCDVAEGGMPL